MRIEEIERKLEQGSIRAISQVRNQVYEIIKKVLDEYYAGYEPSVTYRTHQIASALASSNVRPYSIGADADVYFDMGMLNHPSEYIGKDGFPVKKHWSEGQIMDAVMTGANMWWNGSDVRVWTDSIAILDGKVKNIIKEELIKAGIPVH